MGQDFHTSTPHHPRLAPTQYQSEADPGDFVGEEAGHPAQFRSEQNEMGRSFRELARSLQALVVNQAPRSQIQVRSPPWKFPKLESDERGRVSAMSFHGWRQRVDQMIQQLGISEAIAVNLLTTDPTLIPPPYRKQLQFCETMAHIWGKLTEVFPHKETTLISLKNAVIARPQSGSGHDCIVRRCDETLGALELLTRTHPEHRLSRSEAIACLSSLGGVEVSSGATSILDMFDKGHTDGDSYENLLYKFFTKTRKARLDLSSSASIHQQRLPPPTPHLYLQPSGEYWPPSHQDSIQLDLC